MLFLQGAGTLFFLGILVCEGNQNCRKRENAVETGRTCKNTCEIDADCKGANKKCRCDGACGMSCFNPDTQCAELEPLANGRSTVSTMIIGGKVSYSCNTGYVIKGSRRRTCYADKNWYPPAPTCERGCGQPGNLGNAFPTAFKSEFVVNEIVKYKCRTGYVMRGDPNRTCLEQGWSAVTYYCQLKVCDALYGVYKGTISYTNGRNFGSTATLSCNKGYKAASHTTSVRCYAGDDDAGYGEWSGELTSCEIKTCPPPSEPENGSIPNRFSFGREYGTQIAYQCNVGFKLEGSNTGTCDDEGTWGTLPNCTVDPDCDFQDSTQPTCGYTDAGSLWERVRVVEADGLYGYVSQGRHRSSRLTSAVIPTGRSVQTICLKFKYKLLRSESSLEISYTSGHYHPGIAWISHRQETPNTWHDSLLNIDTDRPIQYKFEVISPTIQIDDIKVLRERCDDACTRTPCLNSGTCVSRASGYTCFCTIDFKGSRCETDRKCSTPPNSATNAELSTTDKIQSLFLPDSSATYRCINNFKLSGRGYYNSVTKSVTTRCVESDGNRRSYWRPSISDISCVEIRCPRPSLNSNQYLIEKSKRVWRVGEEATVRCNEGYDFVSNRVIDTTTCRNDQTWSRRFTECQDVRCPEATLNIAHGRRMQISDDNLLFGATATYECDPNYKLEGERGIVRRKVVKCKRQWLWRSSYWEPSISSLRCMDITCSKPPAGRNPYIFQYPPKTKWNIGERATYRCRTGYEFDTDESPTQTQVVCRNDETWVGSVPACREDLKCVEPTASISKGRRLSLSEKPLLPGSAATYECNEGYKMAGEAKVLLSKEIYCREKTYGLGSQWAPSVSTLTCIPITCSQPQPGRNQYIYQYPPKTKWNIGGRATYRCRSGYEFDINEPPTQIQVVCMKDETWNGAVPACREDLKCAEPRASISRGRRISLSTKPLLPGAAATYQCNEGFKMGGEVRVLLSKEIYCREKISGLGSQWRPDVSTLNCIPITCSRPQPGRNQYIYQHTPKTKWNIGERATYRCRRGYEFDTAEPPTQIHVVCRNDETWNGSVPACREDVKCVEPTVSISNGERISLSVKPLLPGATATYECNEGFKVEGEVEVLLTKEIHCREKTRGLGSLWEPDVSTLNCIRIKCKAPTVQDEQNLQENKPNWDVGENATFRCRKGHKFALDNPITSITCGNNETWLGEATRCVPDLKCEAPEKTIPNGRRIAMSPPPLLPGTNATYRCDHGYRFEVGIAEEITVVCTEKKGRRRSSWVPKSRKLNCTLLVCANIPDDRQYNTPNSKRRWTPGQNATFSCVEGYELVGDNVISCKQNGQWSSDFPACEESLTKPITTTKTTSITPPATTSAHTRRSAGTRSETAQERSTTQSLPPTANTKLDLAILIPGDHRHPSEVLDDYKVWIKALGASVVPNYDLRVSLYQYGKEYISQETLNFFARKLYLDPGSNVSRFESAVDDMPLTANRIYGSLSVSTLTNATTWCQRSRLGSAKVIIILIDRMIRYQVNSIAHRSDCLKFHGASVYFVGVFPNVVYKEKQRFKQRIQDIAHNIDEKKRWYAVERSEMQTIVFNLTRDIATESLRRELRNTCAALPNITSLDSAYVGGKCHWSTSEEHMHAGDKVFLECMSDGHGMVPLHVQCSADGSWHQRKSYQCPTVPVNVGGCGIPDLPDKAKIVNDTAIYRPGTRLMLGCLNGFTLTGKQVIKCKRNGSWTRTNAGCEESLTKLITTTKTTTITPPATTLDHIRRIRGTRSEAAQERSTTQSLPPTAGNKLDLAILIPGDYRHPSEVLDDYKLWIKALGASVVPNYDLRISLYQYGKKNILQETRSANFFARKLYLDPDSNISRFESAVDDMILTVNRIYGSLSVSTLTSAKTWCQRSRFGSAKVIIILVDRMIPSYQVNSIAHHADCLKFQGANVHFVGVYPDNVGKATKEKQRFKKRIQDIARNIDEKKRWYAVERSEMQTIVFNLTRDIAAESLPRELRNSCAALPNITSLDSAYVGKKCHWPTSAQHMHAGDKVFLECVSDGHRMVPLHVQCSAEGSWHQRKSYQCPTVPMNVGGCGIPDLPDKAIIVNDTEIYRAGTRLTLGCLNGFNLTGKQTIKCKRSGLWTRTNAGCKVPMNVGGCGIPDLPDKAKIVNDTEIYRAGTRLMLGCLNGLTLNGKQIIKCKSNGSWTRTNAGCKVP